MSYGSSNVGTYSQFTNDEKRVYLLNLSLAKVTVDSFKSGYEWYKSPDLFNAVNKQSILSNSIPSYNDVKDYYCVITVNGVEYITSKTVDDILTYHAGLKLSEILSSNSNILAGDANGDSNAPTGGDFDTNGLCTKLPRQAYAYFVYWKNLLTGKGGDGITTPGSPESGIYPDSDDSLSLKLTLNGDGTNNGDRIYKSVLSNEALMTKLQDYTPLKIINPNSISGSIKQTGGISDALKKHVLKDIVINMGVPTVSTWDGLSNSNDSDNIAFFNPLLTKSLNEPYGYKGKGLGNGYWIRGTDSERTNIRPDYGSSAVGEGTMIFSAMTGFILFFGVSNILTNSIGVSVKNPPCVTALKYKGETLADGIISQGSTKPTIASNKDLFIDTDKKKLYAYNGHTWDKIGGDDLKTASSTILGGIIVGSGLTITDGTLDVVTDSFNGEGFTTGGAEQNTAIGNSALVTINTGIQNTATGSEALQNNTSGQGNTACGYQSLQDNIDTHFNTAHGIQSLWKNKGGKNTAIGTQSLFSNTTGSDNTAIGYYANVGSANLTNATAIGANATVLKSDTIRLGNSTIKNVITNGSGYFDGITIGKGSGTISNDKRYSTAIGFKALIANTKGSWNTATGYEALTTNTTGNGNTACGYNALKQNSTGDNNTAIGYEADVGNQDENKIDMFSVTNATAIGARAKVSTSNTIQLGNTDVILVNSSGSGSFQGVTIGTGGSSGSHNSNTAIGYQALTNNKGYYNTASGYQALKQNISGSYNTASGYQALTNNTNGNNTAVGYLTLNRNEGGKNNTAIGFEALKENVSGDSNTAIGGYALTKNKKVSVSTGESGNNTAIGFAALNENTSGKYNTATGSSALYANVSGDYNTASGGYALQWNEMGDNNTAIGWHAGPEKLFSNLSNTTAIGYKAKVSISNTIQLGNDSVARVLIKNKLGIGITSPTYPLHVNGEILLGKWVRTSGNGGWYNQTHSGGWYMEDSTWIRSYNKKPVRIVMDSSTTVALAVTGMVGIGTTVPLFPLTCYGIGFFTGAVFGNAFPLYSDNRVKHNEKKIIDATGTLKKLVALKYFKTKLQDVNGETYHEDNIFDLDDSGEPIDVSGNKVQYRTETGFIAQEVEKIPELNYLVTPPKTTSDIYEMVKDASGIEQRIVTGTKSLDHPYSLNYNDLFVMNIQATQELDKRIIYLEQQLALEKIKTSTQEIVLSDVLARLVALE